MKKKKKKYELKTEITLILFFLDAVRGAPSKLKGFIKISEQNDIYQNSKLVRDTIDKFKWCKDIKSIRILENETRESFY